MNTTKTNKPAAKKAAKKKPAAAKKSQAAPAPVVEMRTVKADSFEIHRGDNRPNGPQQRYPYSLVNRFRGQEIEVKRGDQVRAGTPMSQTKATLQTTFQVEAGETEASASQGFIVFEGEISFEDFKRWRGGDLNAHGFSDHFTGREHYTRVVMCHIQRA